MTAKTSTASIVSRARSIWAELGYAQRRLFEVRTGVPLGPRRRQMGVSAGYLERPYRRA